MSQGALAACALASGLAGRDRRATRGLARDEGEPYVAGDESSFVWRHALDASTDRPADRETKKAPARRGFKEISIETSRDQGALDPPRYYPKAQITQGADRGTEV